MTDRDIMAEYLRIEREANGKPQGADVEAIIIWVAAAAGRKIDDVRRIVREGTVAGAV